MYDQTGSPTVESHVAVSVGPTGPGGKSEQSKTYDRAFHERTTAACTMPGCGRPSPSDGNGGYDSPHVRTPRVCFLRSDEYIPLNPTADCPVTHLPSCAYGGNSFFPSINQEEGVS